MASTYSTNLKIELQATGENSGTWGTITNTNLGTALEQAIVGYGNPNYASDANLTLTYTDTNAAQAARALVLNVTSGVSLTGTRELVVPTIQKQYIVQNNTTGSQSITVKTSAGTGITVPNGRKAHLYVDGTNVIYMDDFVDINGGAIDGTTIGANSAAAGTFTTLGATTGNITTVNATTVNATNVEVTNVKAKDGTAAATIADSTGVVSIASNPILSGGTANGVLYLNGSKVATSGSALTFDGTNLGIGTASPATKTEIYGTAAANNIALRVTNTATDGYSTVQLGDGNASIVRNGSAQGLYAGNNSLNLITVSTHPIGFSTNNSLRAIIDSSGNVGIGTASLNAYDRVTVGGTLPSSAGNSIAYAVRGTTPSGTTLDSISFGSVFSTQAASFTLTRATHFYASQSTIGSGSTVTNQYGFYAYSNLTGATNNYGFYSDIASGSNRWNFYAAGTAQNYFAGAVGIGAAPTCSLLVFTGSTNDGIRIQRFAGNYYSELRQTDAQEGLAFLVGDGSTVSEKLRIKGTGQTRFQPRAGNPGGAEAGDVYYDSNDNKLKVYNGTSWVDLH